MNTRARPGSAGKADAGDGGDRRVRILEAAARRFADSGFEQTTVRQIADDVNILSGSLYHHFATKDDMLHEIVRDTMVSMRDNSLRIAAAQLDAEHRLVATILFDLREMTRRRLVHSILYQERKFFRKSPEFSYVIQLKKDMYLAWREIIETGIKEGLFNEKLDIFFTIRAIIRLLNTAADWYNDEEGLPQEVVGPEALDRLINAHLSFILNAIRAKGRVWDPIPRAECEALAQRV